MDEDELEGLREKRLRKALAEHQKSMALEAQKKLVLKNVCEPAAYERLMNVRLANPELYDQVVNMMAYLLQSGKLSGKVSDAQVRAVLERLTARHEGKIEVRRKGDSE